jgi:heme a synthase
VSSQAEPSLVLKKYRTFLMVLAVMIVGLMALGAGVRTMNAGLSCPDWPLCFGKVIPDFHVGVWFEFVHRAYAGVVAILYLAALIFAFRSGTVPKSAKSAAKFGLGFLALQIVMGGLTVLLLVKAVIVTMHLLLATLFLSCVLWMLLAVHSEIRNPGEARCDFTLASIVLPTVVFVQIAIGGLVASTYAGSVCVDWPLCNGQWVPTWRGAIGLQIIHRFYAYSLVVLFVALAINAYFKRNTPHGFSRNLRRLFYAGAGVVLLQTAVGILNLILYIPPQVTVLHQTLALMLLAVSLWISFELRRESLAAGTARPS